MAPAARTVARARTENERPVSVCTCTPATWSSSGVTSRRVTFACSTTRTAGEARTRAPGTSPKFVCGLYWKMMFSKSDSSNGRAGGSHPRHAATSKLAIGELEQDRGLALELRDVIPADRPATAGYPLAALEVQRVERPAPSAPAVAAAAEEPEAAAVQWPVAAPDRRARVEALGRELRLEAAALEQAYRQPALAQPIDERDTGRAGPHDAQVARQRRAVGDRASVDLHRASTSRPANDAPDEG